jgi:hypothetical protein
MKGEPETQKPFLSSFRPVAVSLRDTAIVESLTALHAQHVQTIIKSISYCQLSSRLGMLKNAEREFIGEHGCPVCGKGLHANAASGPENVRALLQAGMKQKEEREAEARMPVAPEPPSPGPVIALKDPTKPDAMFDFTVPAETIVQ